MPNDVQTLTSSEIGFAASGPLDLPEQPTIQELHRRWVALVDEIGDIEIAVDSRYCFWPAYTMEEASLFPEQLEAELKGIAGSPGNFGCYHALEVAAGERHRRLSEMTADPAKFDSLRRAAQAAFAQRTTEFRRKAQEQGVIHLVDRRAEAEAELDAVLDLIWQTPATSIEDCAALLDIALDEQGVPDQIELREETPSLLLMMMKLHAAAPAVEFSWLRRYSTPDRDLATEVFAAAG